MLTEIPTDPKVLCECKKHPAKYSIRDITWRGHWPNYLACDECLPENYRNQEKK